MRCRACNVILEDHEAVRKDTRGEYCDLCSVCLSSIYKSELYEDDYVVDVPQDLLTFDEF